MNMGETLLNREKRKLFQKLSYFEKVRHKLKYPMVISEKFDGVFCAAINRHWPSDKECPENNVVIVSRTGEEYHSLDHLKPYLNKFFKVQNTEVILFEALIPGEKQQVVSGACRDTKKQHEEVKAAIYGIVSETNHITFTSGEGNKFIDPNAVPYFFIVHQVVESEDRVMEIYDAVVAAGGEGIVLSPAMEQKYEPGKRNASMVKLKDGLSFDLEVIGMKGGKEGTKYANTLGTLTCRWKGDDVITVSGMKDDQRDLWWNNPELIIGKIIQVDAMTYTADGMLREPRYKCIRTDKEEADY